MENIRKQLLSRYSLGDASFFILRVLTILGGFAWLSLAPLSSEESSQLIKALFYFTSYSILIYICIIFRPGVITSIYLISLVLDLVFVFSLVKLQPTFDNSFFLGYYMLTALHSFYFGVRFGLFVAVISCLLYFINIDPFSQQIHWTDMALRIVFLFPIAVPLGLLSENLRKKNEEIEQLNLRLEKSLDNITSMQNKMVEHEKYSALGRFTSDVAHEIRNPLTAMGGLARRLEKRLENDTKEKQYINLIISESVRLESILRDVLIYSEKEGNQLLKLDINKPVSEAAPFFCDTCPEKNIKLVEKYTAELQPVNINPDHVKQAVGNIILNAIDAMPNGGTLTISTGTEKLNEIEWQTVTISDTGKGIPEDSQDYIFEPFHSTKRTGLETGLGLPIAHKIMEEHRGFIRVESELGKGSTFMLYFPYQSDEDSKKKPCWEYIGCGIEKDRTRRCPSYPYFGRICFAVAGTFCENRVSGIYAEKIEECRRCPFFKEIKQGKLKIEN